MMPSEEQKAATEVRGDVIIWDKELEDCEG